MDKGSTILELSGSLISSIPMEGVRTTIMAPRMEMGMEQVATRTALIQPHPPRRTKVTLPASSAGRLGTTPLSVLKPRMEMAMEVQGRSPIPSLEVR